MDQNFIEFTHEIDGQVIHGAQTGKSSNPAILFIHGAPGDWRAWGEYLGDATLLDQSFMVAVDRPGYAQSGAGAPQTDFKTQASAIVTAALKQHKGPFILVSHSYGGPMSLQIALDSPEHVAGMVILAGANSPELHGARWYHILANTRAMRMLLPEPLNVATTEMMALQRELKKQADHLDSIKARTVVIQGEKDRLVPLENAAYIKKHMNGAAVETITLKKQGHFLPWKEYDLVKKTILSFL